MTTKTEYQPSQRIGSLIYQYEITPRIRLRAPKGDAWLQRLRTRLPGGDPEGDRWSDTEL